MLIDWFTVCAQGLNFLILVWLLKRFLYKPILAAIAAREKTVAAATEESNANRASTLAEREDLAKKVAAFDADKASRLAQAVQDAGKERDRLLLAARAAADQLRQDDAGALQAERERLAQKVTLLAAREVGQVTRQALRDLAGADLEQQMVGEFLRRLPGLAPDVRASLAAGLRAPGSAAVIRSSAELPAPVRASIQDGLNRALSSAVPVNFQADPDVICGIELDLAGQRVGWSVAEYLRGLERDTAALIAAPAAAGVPGPAPAPSH